MTVKIKKLQKNSFLYPRDLFAYTGSDRNWETRGAAVKMGGMDACGSWFGASTLLKNVKKLWLLVSQVVNFRKLSSSLTCIFICVFYLCV